MEERMYSTGIDHHKKFSVLVTMDEKGKIIKRGRVNGHNRGELAGYFEGLKGRSRVVHEAGWNWDLLHEALEEIEDVEEVILAHPAKTKIIAEAAIKTDELDAEKLAMLLRGDFIARVHAPQKETRERKRILRQRSVWVKARTQTRNRIHGVIDRQKDLKIPQLSDLFGKKGMSYLRGLKLEEPSHTILRSCLDLHEWLQGEINLLEKKMREDILRMDEVVLLQTIPGVGRILGSSIALETDGIERFKSSKDYCSYVGVVPRTHSSGGKTYQGGLVDHGNKWLKSAVIEASWVAISSSGYFGSIYKHHKSRGKNSNVAIVAVARRICQIIWRVLKEKKDYFEEKPISPVAPSLD
jgi:transposase